VIVLIYVVRPLLEKWMEINKDVIRVRRLAKAYVRMGMARSVALEKAREDVFGANARPPLVPEAQTPAPGDATPSLTAGIIHALAHFFRWH
jgi:hypothetical protein